MAFVLIGIAAVVLVLFLTGWRRTAIGLAVFVVVAGGVLFMYNRAQEERALSRITRSEVALEKVTFIPYVGSYKVAGRIRNNSPRYGIRQIDLFVKASDCVADKTGPQCTTIGESTEILNVSIPPGQARDFEESVRFYRSKPRLKGKLEWSWSISRVRAENEP